MTETSAALQSQSDPPPRGWLLARIAAGLCIAAMAAMAWGMVNVGWYRRRDHIVGPSRYDGWFSRVHLSCRPWEPWIVPALIAAALAQAVAGALRSTGRFRACAVIQAAISGTALVLALLLYWLS